MSQSLRHLRIKEFSVQKDKTDLCWHWTRPRFPNCSRSCHKVNRAYLSLVKCSITGPDPCWNTQCPHFCLTRSPPPNSFKPRPPAALATPHFSHQSPNKSPSKKDVTSKEVLHNPSCKSTRLLFSLMTHSRRHWKYIYTKVANSRHLRWSLMLYRLHKRPSALLNKQRPNYRPQTPKNQRSHSNYQPRVCYHSMKSLKYKL